MKTLQLEPVLSPKLSGGHLMMSSKSLNLICCATSARAVPARLARLRGLCSWDSLILHLQQPEYQRAPESILGSRGSPRLLCLAQQSQRTRAGDKSRERTKEEIYTAPITPTQLCLNLAPASHPAGTGTSPAAGPWGPRSLWPWRGSRPRSGCADRWEYPA